MKKSRGELVSKKPGKAIALRSIPPALAALDRLELEVKKADSFEKLEDLTRRAAAVQQAFRPVKEVSDRAGEIWIAADVRLAEELDKLPKAKGAIGQAGPGRGKRGAKVEPRFDGAPTLKELGVTKKRAARGRKLRAVPQTKRKAIIEKLKVEGKGVTPNAVLQQLRQETKATKKHEVATAVFSADGPFDVVIIDPPWPMQKIDRDERPNQDAFDYPVMQEDELREWWLKEMAEKEKLSPDCHLFCWTTAKFLPMALRLIEHWGFRYVAPFVWLKPGGFQPLGLPQYNVEFAVYARKGSPVFIATTDFFLGFQAQRREHSRKPDEFYDTIRRVTGGSRVDVFSREKRHGYAQYGNQIRKFAEAG
jgi:N6-adenosine-specific RNA methylase IME4